MQGALIVAIVFGSIVLALAVVGSTILLAIRIIRGGVTKEHQAREAKEAGMIQEMFQQLSRMETRIEALETILLDRQKGNGSDETN